MFSLEALDANNGDCLFLHFGSVDNPRLIIIDGGPQFSGRSTFNSAIKPRLREMAYYLDVDLPLPVELLMVSHIDDDHIGGVLKLLNEANGSSNPLVNIKALWHNSFDDFLRTDQLDALASFGATSGSAAAAFDSHTLAAAAGVKQGLALRDKANDLGIVTNAGTSAGFVSAEDKIRMGPLRLRVLGPTKKELEDLQEKFDDENPNLASMTASARRRALASFTDGSVANLASIVVLAEQNGKRMLLTGDARGDNIIRGLEDANLMTNGAIDLDILKVPHHGSDRNVSTTFFKKVRAKHYVFSADGAHDNPDTATLAMLTNARRHRSYTMWFTHRLDQIEEFIENDRARFNRNYNVEYREGGASSLWVDLEEDLTF